MRISDWSSDVCSSDLVHVILAPDSGLKAAKRPMEPGCTYRARVPRAGRQSVPDIASEMALPNRSEEHTSELQSLMRISYAVFCLKKKKDNTSTATLRGIHSI